MVGTFYEYVQVLIKQKYSTNTYVLSLEWDLKVSTYIHRCFVVWFSRLV